ncbi:MAG: NPCBM/NEW2 domain-containing protein [Planctomycetes bacterium]|nr:NPCBM/NEW2 domain-containing protein [Planctomycetota bacterium]
MSLARPLCYLHLIVLIVSCFASAADSDERQSHSLLVVDDEAVPAAIDELMANWSIAVRVDGERKEVVKSDYVLWGRYADHARLSQLLLSDGTLLVGDLVRIERDSVTLTSRLWGEIRIDRQFVQACILLSAADPLKRDRERQALKAVDSTDGVHLLNGDVVTGKLLPTTERDSGGLFGLVSLGVESSNNGARTSIRAEEVRAITFNTRVHRTPQAECLLGFRDGSFIAASRLTRTEPTLTQITTVAGALLQLPTSKLQESITFIQPQSDSVTYLSDLPAIGYKSIPFLDLKWPLGVAKNTLGGRLRSDGTIVFKGLGMHSISRVAYALNGKYRQFQAELALDDHANRQGSVVYQVLVEQKNEAGERTWTLAFTSSIIRGGDSPLSITIDVTEARRLALVVEMADRADTRDYANWLNARLLR